MAEINVGSRITYFRNDRGLTQKDVATAIGVSNKTVSKWETGLSSPSINELVALSEFFGVSTDVFLGLSHGENDIKDSLRKEFDDLTKAQAAQKVFELTRCLLIFCFETMAKAGVTYEEFEQVLPDVFYKMPKFRVSTNAIFDYMVSSDDLNLSIMQMQNKSDFAWLFKRENQENIANMFKLLADVDVVKVLGFINSAKCSSKFTAEYVSKNTGVSAEKVKECLTRISEIAKCIKLNVHLTTGNTEVYEFAGDGVILAMLSLAYDRTTLLNNFNYNWTDSEKLIGGQNK